jgi:hypothetical protein
MTLEEYSSVVSDETYTKDMTELISVFGDGSLSNGERIAKLFPNLSIEDQYKIALLIFAIENGYRE